MRKADADESIHRQRSYSDKPGKPGQIAEHAHYVIQHRST